MPLSPQEAVWSFAAWLAGRKEETVFSRRHDSAPIVELVTEFCAAQNWPKPFGTYNREISFYTKPKGEKKDSIKPTPDNEGETREGD